MRNDTLEHAKGYDAVFFDEMVHTSKKAAEFIVPDLIHKVQCKSILDLGCGTGEWLSVWEKHGIQDLLGVDGDYVSRSAMKISPDKFFVHDLEKPFDAGRKFDLAMSVEVAEHLPESAADNFVDSLTRHADVIVFSAAVPGQVGTWHINEQWQSYWKEKFESRGYEALDYVRNKWWNNPHIVWWYRQNILIYVKADKWDKYPNLKKEREKNKGIQKPNIHPDFEFHLKHIHGFKNQLLAKPWYIVNKFIFKIWYSIFTA